MSTPATPNSQLAQFSLYGQAIGSIGSMFASMSQAESVKSSLEFQADMAGINARIAELGAQSALGQGAQQVAALTLNAGKVKSAQRASMAANGIDLGVGNAAEVQASTEIMKEIDKNTLEANAMRSAWGYRTQSMNASNDALVKRTSAAGISATSAGATSLITGASRVAGSWYLMDKAGAFNSTSADVNTANNSSDPIGAMAILKGW